MERAAGSGVGFAPSVADPLNNVSPLTRKQSSLLSRKGSEFSVLSRKGSESFLEKVRKVSSRNNSLKNILSAATPFGLLSALTGKYEERITLPDELKPKEDKPVEGKGSLLAALDSMMADIEKEQKVKKEKEDKKKKRRKEHLEQMNREIPEYISTSVNEMMNHGRIPNLYNKKRPASKAERMKERLAALSAEVGNSELSKVQEVMRQEHADQLKRKVAKQRKLLYPHLQPAKPQLLTTANGEIPGFLGSDSRPVTVATGSERPSLVSAGSMLPNGNSTSPLRAAVAAAFPSAPSPAPEAPKLIKQMPFSSPPVRRKKSKSPNPRAEAEEDQHNDADGEGEHAAHEENACDKPPRGPKVNPSLSKSKKKGHDNSSLSSSNNNASSSSVSASAPSNNNPDNSDPLDIFSDLRNKKTFTSDDILARMPALSLDFTTRSDADQRARAAALEERNRKLAERRARIKDMYETALASKDRAEKMMAASPRAAALQSLKESGTYDELGLHRKSSAFLTANDDDHMEGGDGFVIAVPEFGRVSSAPSHSDALPSIHQQKERANSSPVKPQNYRQHAASRFTKMDPKFSGVSSLLSPQHSSSEAASGHHHSQAKLAPRSRSSLNREKNASPYFSGFSVPDEPQQPVAEANELPVIEEKKKKKKLRRKSPIRVVVDQNDLLRPDSSSSLPSLPAHMQVDVLSNMSSYLAYA